MKGRILNEEKAVMTLKRKGVIFLKKYFLVKKSIGIKSWGLIDFLMKKGYVLAVTFDDCFDEFC